MNQWILLVYKVPNEPSAKRVYVWRKLKRLAALLIHDSVWVLPATGYTREQMQWLAAEILEMEGGEAYLWEAQQILGRQEEVLIQQFIRQAETSYQEILDALHTEDANLAALSRQYQQVKSQDYFQAPLGNEVRASLVKVRGDQVE